MDESELDAEQQARVEGAIQRAKQHLEAFDPLNREMYTKALDRSMVEIAAAIDILEGRSRRGPRTQGAKARMLEYLLERGVGARVSSTELHQIARIQEWPRRIRELRVEVGWDIRYDQEDKTYRLESGEPDETVAVAWGLANSIRRKHNLSARNKILEYLKARVREVVTSEMLHYVSGIQEHGRRIRELRTEHGYPISSNIDRPELEPGEYVLESVEPTLDVTERKVSEELRRKVFERDGYRCVACGCSAGPGVLLTAHHLVAKVEGGSDTDPDNFVTLCHKDHASITGDQQRELLRKRREGRR